MPINDIPMKTLTCLGQHKFNSKYFPWTQVDLKNAKTEQGGLFICPGSALPWIQHLN